MDLIRTLPLKGRVETDIPMRELTTLRVGGKADCVVFAGSESDVEQIALFCADRDVPLTVVGRGSNLLVRDGGLSGVVLLMGKTFAGVRVEENRVYAQAGATLGAAARAAQQAGLAGLEFAEGIPGSVGGGVRMNAGAYGGEMSGAVERVRVLQKNGEVIWLDKAQMDFGYRHSAVEECGAVVLEAVFALQPDDREAIAARMSDYAVRRREKQPLTYPSAGSFFKRPEGYFAGKLIEDAGLKGASVGGAQVSEKHAGFLINMGNATAADFLQLKDLVQRTVYEKYGVQLEPEVRIIGRD